LAEYPNRSDLRNPATRQVAFTGQTYGQAAQQAAAQQAVAPGSAPAQVQAQQAAAQQAAPRPGAKPLFRPTERPAEPITAGADFGPGPNGRQAGLMPRIVPQDDVMEELRVLYQMFPNDDLADLISKYGIGS
jgi:hypothetical protein